MSGLESYRYLMNLYDFIFFYVMSWDFISLRVEFVNYFDQKLQMDPNPNKE